MKITTLSPLNSTQKLLVGLILFYIVLLLASVIFTPHNPNAIFSEHIQEKPNAQFWLGTDSLGRDIFSRILTGTQSAFIIGLSCVIISSIIGVTLGIISGYAKPWVGEIINKFFDAWLSLPSILIILCFIAIFSTGIVQTIIAISLTGFTSFSKVARAKTLSIKERHEVAWAKTMGFSEANILFHIVLPEILPAINTIAAIHFSTAILTEAGLSYLGLGIQEPQASWGNILSRAQPYMLTQPQTVLVPGLLITLLVFTAHTLADNFQQQQLNR